MAIKIEPIARLALLIAAANYSDLEILDLFRRLQSLRVEDFSELVRSAQERNHQIPPTTQLAIPIEEEKNVGTSPMDTDVAMQIERLLVKEAALTRVAAADALTKALRRRHPGRVQVPYKSKDGFSSWLKQLAGEFSLSEILHAAATIRSSRAHSQNDAWLINRK